MIVEVGPPPKPYHPPEAWGGYSYLLRLISDEIADKFFQFSDFWSVDLLATSELVSDAEDGLRYFHRAGGLSLHIYRRGNKLMMVMGDARTNCDNKYVLEEYEMTLEVILMRPPRN